MKINQKISPIDEAAEFIKGKMQAGICSASEILNGYNKRLFSRVTLFKAKKLLNIRSVKISEVWFWTMDETIPAKTTKSNISRGL
jgi:hypothetical protein